MVARGVDLRERLEEASALLGRKTQTAVLDFDAGPSMFLAYAQVDGLV